MVLSFLHCQGVLLILTIVGQGPSVASAGGGCLDIFSSRKHRGSVIALSSSSCKTFDIF